MSNSVPHAEVVLLLELVLLVDHVDLEDVVGVCQMMRPNSHSDQ